MKKLLECVLMIKYFGLNKIKNSILTTAPRDAFYKKCKSLSHGDDEMLKELLFEKFLARDKGDEPEDDLKFNSSGREVDIEVDGDFICDYTFCTTAKDFEQVSLQGLDKLRRYNNRHYSFKHNVILKFRRLTRQKGITMPTLDDLVTYLLQPERYQDKLSFFNELIEAYNEELTSELNKIYEDDFVIPW